MLRTFVKVFGVLLLCSGVAYSHDGRTDSTGGHNNRKTGEYHCHKEPCFSNHRRSEEAVNEALQEKQLVSTLYNRRDWPHWVDADRDCQNARAEALIAASTVPVKFRRSEGCVVSNGSWFDPYTGSTFTQAGELDIDHIIPQSKLRYDSLDHPNFQKCWALENLRPICSIENIRKSNK